MKDTNCPGMLDNSATNSGAAYVFVRNGTNWTYQAYLKPPNPDAFDYFGHSIAISGNNIVVGAPEEDSSTTIICNPPIDSTNCPGMMNNGISNSGAAYVFVRQ